MTSVVDEAIDALISKIGEGGNNDEVTKLGLREYIKIKNTLAQKELSDKDDIIHTVTLNADRLEKELLACKVSSLEIESAHRPIVILNRVFNIYFRFIYGEDSDSGYHYLVQTCLNKNGLHHDLLPLVKKLEPSKVDLEKVALSIKNLSDSVARLAAIKGKSAKTGLLCVGGKKEDRIAVALCLAKAQQILRTQGDINKAPFAIVYYGDANVATKTIVGGDITDT